MQRLTELTETQFLLKYRDNPVMKIAYYFYWEHYYGSENAALNVYFRRKKQQAIKEFLNS